MATGTVTGTEHRLDINDHGTVYLACKVVSAQWRDLGTRLGVMKLTLDIIQANNRGDVEECMSEVIDKWLKRDVLDQEADPPTWRTFCLALSHIYKPLAEVISLEHGCGYISPTVAEVTAQSGVPPAFLSQSCGCGQCTVRGWMTGNVCQKMYYDRRPKLVVANPTHPQVAELETFESDYDRKARLCSETRYLAQFFKMVSSETWNCVENSRENVEKIALQLGARISRPLRRVSDVHELQNLVHSLGVSWFNFTLLHFLADHFLSSNFDLMTIWRDYIAIFREYCSARNLKQFTNIFFRVESHNVFLLEVDECYDDFTLSDIKALHDSLSLALDVPSVCLHLVTVRGGSLIIYFHYCYSDYLTIFESLTTLQLRSLSHIEPYKILSLTDLHNRFTYDDIQEYNSGEKQPQLLFEELTEKYSFDEQRSYHIDRPLAEGNSREHGSGTTMITPTAAKEFFRESQHSKLQPSSRMSVTGASFGQKRPPLYHLITNILREYPSGQVFKEIIQNADDAGATEVIFYLDCRNLSTLPHQLVPSDDAREELYRFQGPALMAYNNAPFQEEDWDGIQNLQQSGKAKNPHKVGKFGIGFNSVYHITDLAVIISEESYGYLEPQEEVWRGESGKKYGLSALQSSCPVALQPYHAVTGFSPDSSFMGKTLFRFPLRNKPSKLSSNVCTTHNIRQLLEALKAEAKYLLLFLRSVCSIEVIEISDSSQHTEFKVAISPANLANHQIQQNALVTKAKQIFPKDSEKFSKRVICEKTEFGIEIEVDGHKINHEWLVVHRIGCENDDVIALAKLKHIIPWVGTAYELSQSGLSDGGRIYCCLPLPTEDRAPFSINVNGTFVISSNRRSLNWESQEHQGDDEGKWNKFLVERCIPHCYARLIQELIKVPSISPDVVYKCWPVISRVVHTPWEGLLQPLFQILLNSPNAIVHTGVADHDEWISLNNAVLIPENECLPETLTRVVSSTGTKLVSLYSNQWRVLEKYYSGGLTNISPSLVRNVLKANQYYYCNLPPNEKLVILKFCLFDKKYSDLAGLELIPLANGTFSKFVQCNRYFVKKTANIYACSSSVPHNLLPGLEHIMIEHSHYSLLEQVAKSGETQLAVLTEVEVAELVPQSNPHSWSSAQLEKFWTWLGKHSLAYFNSLPIVPVLNACGVKSMHNLSKQSHIVHVPKYTWLDNSLRTGLEKCGANVLCISEFPYLNHNQLGSFTYDFNASDVLDALSDAYVIGLLKFSNDECNAIQSFFQSIQKLCVHHMNKICAMVIFSVVQETTRYSINQLKPSTNKRALVRNERFLFSDKLLLSHPLIFETGQPVLNKVPDHIQAIDEASYLELFAFPAIRNGTFPQQNIDDLMICILDNFRVYMNKYHYQKKKLSDILSDLKFVTIENGDRKTPSSLFDPSEAILCRLYQGKPLFPSGIYAQNYLYELRQCGLKGLNSVAASMLFEVAQDMPTVYYGESVVQNNAVAFNRALALMEVLREKCSNMLNQSVWDHNNWHQQTLCEAICQLAASRALLPIASNKPSNYPDCLKWRGSSHNSSLTKFDASNVIVLPHTVDYWSLYIDPRIIGSEALFVQNIPSPICQKLMQSSRANLSSCVVRHFKHVIQNKEEIDSAILQQISFRTYEYLNSINCKVSLSSEEKWVWVESCSEFLIPGRCAISSTSFSSSLEPFIYVLPKNMKKYESFLCRHGVRNNITSEHIMWVLKRISMLSGDDHVVSANNAWALVRNILEWVVENKIDFDDILVPISSEATFPKLSPVSEVFYIDNEVLHEIAESVDEDYTLIDSSISHLAPKLSVTPLSDHLEITSEVFEDAGQHEPLTTRLSNILKEYRDGLTIVKEMIQNADDAEATEVNILYDSREHTRDKLLFKGMADSHGPALVVHNNAKFTKEDFTNITKLAGATKKDKPLKIGKFGVGFCSVYHITDVPSFVSGEWLYIFDPTLSHLKGIVKNENQRGKKIKYMSKYVAKTNQLAPYQNLFTFDASCEYEGTMFRFPFRKHPSQISSTIYTLAMINQIKKDLEKNGKLFLLFLSNVKRIRFLTVSSGRIEPTEEIVIEKSLASLMPQRNLLRIDTTNCQTHNIATEHWLVSTKFEDKYHIYDLTTQLATASVACQLIETSTGDYEVVPVDGLVFCYLPLSVPSTGLPVHISANFAVMSNRSGIWTSGSSATPSDSREWWNQQLMVTIIQTAYCELLIMLKEIFVKLVSYNYHTLLPLGNSIQHPWQMMIQPFCRTLVDSPLFYSKFSNEWFTLRQTRFLSHDILSTVHSTTMPQCVTDCLSIMKLFVVDIPQQHLHKLVSILHSITIAVFGQNEFCFTFFESIEIFSDQWETRNELLFNIFITAASEIASDGSSELTELLRNHPCIPSTPDGVLLKQAQQLVDPKSDLEKLFDKNSEVFPLSKFCDRQAVHELMINIGLLTTHLPWDMVLECAKSIQAVYKTDIQTALVRVSILIETIEKNIKKDTNEDYTSDLSFSELKNTSFLPVAKPPEGYMLSWKGAGMDLSSPANMFYPSPTTSYSVYKRTSNIQKECWLLGSQRVLVNSCFVEEGGCGTIDSTVLRALHIDRNAHLGDVLANYQQLLKSQYTVASNDDVKHIEYICQITYEFIENRLKVEMEQQSPQSSTSYTSYSRRMIIESECVLSTETGTALAEYQSKPFIWVGNSFESPENVSFKWNENGPFLYRLPSILLGRELLINALCIKENFTIEKLLNTLKEMHQQLGDGELNKPQQKVVNAIVSELNTHGKDDFKNFSNETSLILPSAVNTLMLAKHLSFDDSQRLPINANSTLVHKVLTREIALALGVKPIRGQFLEKYTAENSMFGRTEFAQREELTQRIRNILRDYPLDATVLKELLQNADDAGATKMCIILDKRQHGTERLPSKEWSELQGPALVVWNDEEFKEKDIEGIQKLGLGSKRDDSESIGQFGIGFNVVYHLTDCPSFISGGKTLCVFDPHCRYAPGATALNPGRRYDGLQDYAFWDVMSDMRAAYFRSPPLKGQPIGLNYGSLFRFPLRSTRELVMKSEIIESKGKAERLSADIMERILADWVVQIKEALVFLNHITEVSYYVVEKDEQFNLKYQYKLSMDSAAVQCRANMFECLKGFKKNRQPHVFNYQITLECTKVNMVGADELHVIPSSYNISSRGSSFTKFAPLSLLQLARKTYQEEWFIQQGVGDIGKPPSEQKWQFINRVLPKHGIATSLNELRTLDGKLFCFLPLQTYSGLPVHINGQFVLSSNRRSLWVGSAEGVVDEKRDWNNLLFDAIASSYVHFMSEARDVIVKDEEYTDKNKFYACINKYYSLFPMWRSLRNVTLEQNCFRMAKLVFQRIWQSNAGVLAVEIHSKKDVTTFRGKALLSTIKVQWNNLRNEQDPFKQVYFQPQLDNKEEKAKLISLLRRIKVALTCAAHIFCENLITDKKTKPLIATPASVFQFYCLFHDRIIPQSFPCHIVNTPFKTANMFHLFIEYMLVVTKQNSIEKQFPQTPLGYPLLLTADNVLRCFESQNKVIKSTYSKLFRSSLSSFLHDVLLQSKIDSDYFLITNKIKFSPIIENLLMANLPKNLLGDKLNNCGENTCIGFEDLRLIWECLTSESDPLLKNHEKEILSMWALTPATNGYLYSTRCSALPIMPPCLDELDDVDKTAFNIFVTVGLPVIDDSDLLSDCGLLDVCQKYFPTITDYDRILTILYHLHQEQSLFDNISSNDVKGILKYFQKTGFIHNQQLKDQILALPLFNSIEGHLTTLRNKMVYLWPCSGFCNAGYKKWVSSDVVFLEHNGDWRELTNDFANIGKYLIEKEIYFSLILPNFDKLLCDERKSHLEYIMENIYPDVNRSTEIIQYSSKRSLNEEMQFDLLFIEALKKLKCIEHPKTLQLYPIHDFSDHTLEIFKAFSNSFIFLPEAYREVKWYKFFCDLGLQTTVNTGLFIQFCRKVADGEHDNLETSSKVLLEYLFSSKARKWDDNALHEIADICFVKVADVPHLSWIKAPCSPPLEIMPGRVNLTKLNQSVVFESAPLIWTVKPVFNQPPINIMEESYRERERFLEKLSVTSSPFSKDIVTNLVNISKGQLANFDFFTTYNPETLLKAEQPSISLLRIVSMCMDELKTNECSSEVLSPLKDCACVPVFAKPPNTILVRPIQVVKMLVNQKDAQFKPYINVLPDELMIFSSLLEKIGVCNTINLIHVRHVLETLHLKFGEGNQTDDPNIIQLMHHSIVKLNELLSKEEETSQLKQDQLNPLYLPFSTGRSSWSLKPSRKLVFVDSSRYESRQPEKFNFVETCCSLFEIPKDTTDISLTYTQRSLERAQGYHTGSLLTERMFCLLLPPEVCPQHLSLNSLERRLNVGYSINNTDTNIAIALLKQSKGFLKDFEETLRQMLTLLIEFETDSEMESFIEAFYSIWRNIDFVLFSELKATLVFGNKNIGTLTSPKYVLEKEQDKYILYVDESVRGEPDFFYELSRSLLIEIARLMNTNLSFCFKMIEPMSKYFQVSSLEELGDEYEVYSSLKESMRFNTEDDHLSILPAVGKKIPEEFMSRLDNSINSIFYPQEWVAYEVSEENFIWAMILYPVTNQASGSSYRSDRYMISADSENEAREVSVCDLYKIVPADSSETHSITDKKASTLALKRTMYTNLTRISVLADETEKKKAMKRLYLQYHPDKVREANKDNYEEAFLFLRRQIDRLSQGQPLEDPSEPEDDVTVYQPSATSESSSYSQWDVSTAQSAQDTSSQKNDGRQMSDEKFHFPFSEFQTQPDQEESMRLNMEDDSLSFLPVVGKKISEEFMRRLDNNINSIFYPQEWVAYEVSEENFIWAMILYPVTNQASGSNSQLDRYMIIADSENEAREVLVCDLYKIVPADSSETDHSTTDKKASTLALKCTIYTDLTRISVLADEAEKKKAIKRLYIQYHPDKVRETNKDSYEEAFLFLKHQIDRLNEGQPLEDPSEPEDDLTVYQPSPTSESLSYFQWDIPTAQSTQDTSSQKNDGRQMSDEKFHFPFSEYQAQPDQAEAKRWLKQSYTDYNAMRILLKQEQQYCHERGDMESVACQIIFLAHEVIEKALKAGMYQLVGLDPGFLSNHQLLYHARSISSQRPGANALTSSSSVVSLVTIVSWIDCFYLASRYPNNHPQYLAPVDVFSRKDAEMAADYAQTTYEFIKSLIT